MAQKEVGIAYALMLFSLIGLCGVYYFYLGRNLKALLWLLTFGLFGVGLVFDIFTLHWQVRAINARR